MSATAMVPLYLGGPKCGDEVPKTFREAPRVLLASLHPSRRHAYVRRHDDVFEYHGEVVLT